MATEPELYAHQEWLGYVQPVGLVVSAPALLAAQAYINRNIIPDHRRFLDGLSEHVIGAAADPVSVIADFPRFVREVLDWQASDLVGAPDGEPLPTSLEVPLPEYQETLRPTYAIREDEADAEGNRPWLMLIEILPVGSDLDAPDETDRHWQATPQARFERLLRETSVPIGLLCNGTQLRLVYAPRGETSGHITFPVQAMSEVAGRPIFAALHMLLCAERVFTLPAKQRLAAILAESRRYQNLVSTRLSAQVLAALYELLRGFQAADERRKGELLRDVLAADPDHVYAGLLTVLLRLVFLLYAEDRGLLSNDPVYVNHYSVNGLFERLRADVGRYPDTMDQRYGAWAQLLTLFRLIHDGGSHGNLRLPPRHGYLFHPDRYCFLEGRAATGTDGAERIDPPAVSDGVLFRVLQNLLLLDGERLSYRTLDVEQIGSVYETVMGFHLRVAEGRSIAVRAAKAHGAPIAINLDALLAVASGERAKWWKENADQNLTGAALNALKVAKAPEEIVAALGRKVATHATPSIVPAGSMLLQPSDERRRSGSHYTPRTLTEPIVRTTLRPQLKALGAQPTPEQILDLKVCDLAMGSGAFLVEACRQLGDELVRAWHAHDCLPAIPPDEDEVLHARRRVAQRCLYGVDRNPMATDLAKLSLWLATLAKDHPFTFLDHSLRSGDSLVGLTTEQLADFHWRDEPGRVLGQEIIEQRIRTATAYRKEILEADEELVTPAVKLDKLRRADDALDLVRRAGNCVVAAFFSEDKDKARESARKTLLAAFTAPASDVGAFQKVETALVRLDTGTYPVRPFHWEIEYPEVFGRTNPGFDAMIGNPPFVGGTLIRSATSLAYLDWLNTRFIDAGDRTDLIAYFFRRSFGLLRSNGALGHIATNTIAQGDTRRGGLRWICKNGGMIYAAKRRLKWPGEAAVMVSVVHVGRNSISGPCVLDGKPVSQITAFLFHAGGHDDPAQLAVNYSRSFEGFKLAGQGFVFDDEDSDANPISELDRLVRLDPRNGERIFPYIGGEELNSSPTHSARRKVINFGSMSLEAALEWPQLIALVRTKVKPVRDQSSRDSHRLRWWQYGETRPGLVAAIQKMDQVLAVARTSKHLGFCFLKSTQILNENLVIFTYENAGPFSVFQSRLHEIWVAFNSSTLEDRQGYRPSDCFDTFAFPAGFETSKSLEKIGREYYEFRAELMVRNDEGLTKTYNRFHDPNETSPDIQKLRELHAAMDRAVLDAYGWTDIPTDCEFLLDYEDEEDDDSTSKRKKPWRYRWPDNIRDEVLARLLALNQQRAEEERRSAPPPKAPAKRATKKKSAGSEGQGSLGL